MTRSPCRNIEHRAPANMLASSDSAGAVYSKLLPHQRKSISTHRERVQCLPPTHTQTSLILPHHYTHDKGRLNDFLPMTSSPKAKYALLFASPLRSVIRHAMVKIMLASAASQRSRPKPRGESLLTNTSAKAALGENRPGMTQAAPPLDASMCIFWSAAAIGSLLQGRPVESVRGREGRVLAMQTIV